MPALYCQLLQRQFCALFVDLHAEVVDAQLLAVHVIAFGERLPEIPDFAVDMHTGRGEAMGRDYLYFMTEASKVVPEIADKDQTYRDWILAALKDGRLS